MAASMDVIHLELDLEMASALMAEAELALMTSLSTHYAAPVLNWVHSRIPRAQSTIASANTLCKLCRNSYLALHEYRVRGIPAAACIQHWWRHH